MKRLHTLAAVLLGSGLATVSAQSGFTPQGARSTVPPPARTVTTSPAQSHTAQKGLSGPGVQNVSGGNDACGSASLILGVGPYLGDNLGAVLDGPAAGCTGLIDTDVWYEWIAPATGPTTVSTCNAGTAFDTVLTVTDGGCGGVEIACNDDAGGCGLTSVLTFPATEGNSYLIRIGGFSGATGAYEMTIALPPQRGSDGCPTPDPVAGPGPHAFDTTLATTGAQGQTDAACFEFSTTAIDNDVWFRWTAPESGPTTVTTCGQTGVDTKIAVYDGVGCPGAGALDCNDDTCGLQSSVTFGAVKGNAYTIQLGTFPGAAGGPGTFTITGPQPADACAYDDGTTDIAWGGTTTEIAAFQRFGGPGETSLVHSVSFVHGDPANPSSTLVGSMALVSIFDDPNEDGMPDDAVLVATKSSVIHSVDADVYGASAFDSPVLVDGYYFAVVTALMPGINSSMSVDSSVAAGNLSWAVTNFAGGINYSDLSGQDVYGTTGTFGCDCVWMIRVDCESVYDQFCVSGADLPPLSCPCSNEPAGGGLGCDNFGGCACNPKSGTLEGSGAPFVGAGDTVQLSVTGMNNTSLTIFFGGTAPVAPVIAGAGLRCVGGTLKRLYSGNGVSGAITKPSGADPSVSMRSAMLNSTILPGQTRFYYNAYRDPAAAAPCGFPTSTINTTNALSIKWQ